MMSRSSRSTHHDPKPTTADHCYFASSSSDSNLITKCGGHRVTATDEQEHRSTTGGSPAAVAAEPYHGCVQGGEKNPEFVPTTTATRRDGTAVVSEQSGSDTSEYEDKREIEKIRISESGGLETKGLERVVAGCSRTQEQQPSHCASGRHSSRNSAVDPDTSNSVLDTFSLRSSLRNSLLPRRRGFGSRNEAIRFPGHHQQASWWKVCWVYGGQKPGDKTRALRNTNPLFNNHAIVSNGPADNNHTEQPNRTNR